MYAYIKTHGPGSQKLKLGQFSERVSIRTSSCESSE